MPRIAKKSPNGNNGRKIVGSLTMKALKPDMRHYFIPRTRIPEGGQSLTQDKVAFVDLPGNIQIRFDHDKFVVIIVPLSVSLYAMRELLCDELVDYLETKNTASMAAAAPLLKKLLSEAMQSAQTMA